MDRKIFVFVIFIASVAAAQEKAQPAGRFETGLDYSSMRVKVPNSAKPVDVNGIQLGGTVNANRWLGLSADFGAYYHCVAGCIGYGDLAHNYVLTFLAGPRVRLRPGRTWQPFVQAQAGVANISYTDELSLAPSPTGVGVVKTNQYNRSGLAYDAGGGLDWVKGRFVFRVAQVDYFHYNIGQRSENTVRFTMGVRFQLGMPKDVPRLKTRSLSASPQKQ